jgi:hypothetical protein
VSHVSFDWTFFSEVIEESIRDESLGPIELVFDDDLTRSFDDVLADSLEEYSKPVKSDFEPVRAARG